MLQRGFWNTALICTLAISGACVDSDDEGGAGAPDEISWRGQTYDRLAALPVAAPAAATAAASDPAAALASRPRAELAEALRMTVLHPNGAVYAARTPNWEAADAVLQPSGPIERLSKAMARPGGTPAAAALAELTAARGPGKLAPIDASVAGPVAGPVANIVFGGDNRAPSPTTIEPYYAISKIDVYTSAAGGAFRITCTGAYIGPWTFVTAGHCLRFSDGTFAKRIVFQTARSGSSLPFGTQDCRNGDSVATNDFFAAVPAGYTGGIESPLNFAVIDTYPCHAAPRAIPGYTVNIGSGGYSLHGYPLGRCPNASADGIFMCGHAGSGYPNSDWLLESSDLDATSGQDGAPWIAFNPTRVIGVHLGYREYFDFGRCGFDNCRRNYARKIDGGMDTFIRQISFDF